ncbi:MAG: hypothetical protein PW734_01440 [Verrucomicrobium sp.]|nr:hypothetical protein [Verrucomicrobium sp.]
MKMPAFQFYPADWRKDPGVQSMSFHQRGIWFEILCLMHESPVRGVLLLPNGKAMSEESLAHILGLKKQNLTETLSCIMERGVADRDLESGALVNRRMVRDEKLRKMRTEFGKLGGNPILVNGGGKQAPTIQVNQNSTPSSSISSSIKEQVHSPQRDRLPFWPGCLEDVLAVGANRRMSRAEAEEFWHHYEAVSWVDGAGRAITNWQSQLEKWCKGEKPQKKGTYGKNNDSKGCGGSGPLDMEQRAKNPLKRL